MAVTVTETRDPVDGRRIAKFTSSISAGGGQDSVEWSFPEGVTQAWVLLVGGGGCGGYGDGGGGAGGYVEVFNLSVTTGPHTIKIGAGGIYDGAHKNGANTEAFGLVAYGGGAGGGNDGGSGVVVSHSAIFNSNVQPTSGQYIALCLS